ncbi:MAG: hypothetical protein IJE43_03565 [Alphaproteobacteria bacterium]|nr:hypothetical protein [Alphaproteobacteria bacterium]
MKIAICKDSKQITHSTSWVYPWEKFCKDNKIDYEIIDPLRCDVINELRRFDVLLWHFGQYRYAEMLEARSILYSAKKMGLKVFPDFNDSWHFDDKIAETYILQSICAPLPDSKIYYDNESVKNDIDAGIIKFPVVGKLRTGSGSHNVKLLKNEHALLKYAASMFNGGYNPAPSLLYKTTSNIRSSHSIKQFFNKFRRIPEFLRNLTSAKQFPNEKNYVYLQQFIQNDGFDMKVVVVGDKCTFLVRPIRTNDFRASGGGEVFFDKKYFKKQIIESAFKVSDLLGVNCMGYDYVVDKETGEGLIVEMIYGFSHEAIMSSGGYYDRNLQWHDEPLNAPYEIIKHIIN